MIGEPPIIEPLEEVLVVLVSDSSKSDLERESDDFDEEEDSDDKTLEISELEKPTWPLVELKPLPSRLTYVFLNSDVEWQTFISDKLSKEETAKLIAILEKHRPVFGYAL